MIGLAISGACCAFPRRPYSPATLPAEYHSEVWEAFRRAALRDHRRAADLPRVGQERIRTAAQRRGLEERATESASVAYAHWQGLEGAQWIAYGDHGRAVAATIRFMRRSAWQGATGYRRDQNRKATGEALAMAARLRQRSVPTPCDLAMWAERLPVGGGAGGVRAQRRRAERVAERLGLSVDGLARLANGLAIESGAERPRLMREGSLPAPVRCPAGAHCPWSAPGQPHATTY